MKLAVASKGNTGNGGSKFTSGLVDQAREFALKEHGETRHAETSYEHHLSSVAAKVESVFELDGYGFTFFDKEAMLATAWLHDVIEDTKVTQFKINALFGQTIGTMVGLLTDSPGKNRLERHLLTYYKLRTAAENNFTASMAYLVKLCDRWHNHSRSIAMSQKYAAMYADEYHYFKVALWMPNFYPEMWKELDAQYEQLNQFRSLHPKERLKEWRKENESGILLTQPAKVLEFPIHTK